MIRNIIVGFIIVVIVISASVTAQTDYQPVVQYLSAGLLFNDRWICVPKPEPEPDPKPSDDGKE